jgi:hypothetical protein
MQFYFIYFAAAGMKLDDSAFWDQDETQDDVVFEDGELMDDGGLSSFIKG